MYPGLAEVIRKPEFLDPDGTLSPALFLPTACFLITPHEGLHARTLLRTHLKHPHLGSHHLAQGPCEKTWYLEDFTMCSIILLLVSLWCVHLIINSYSLALSIMTGMGNSDLVPEILLWSSLLNGDVDLHAFPRTYTIGRELK